MNTIHLGVDASNIGSGGGLTHLTNLLAEAEPWVLGVSVVTVWCSRRTAQLLPERSWLKKVNPAWAEAGVLRRSIAQQLLLPRLLRKAGCQALFSPGGTLPMCAVVPMVTMSQNMLPFEPDEAALFGIFSLMRFKMWLLGYSQRSSFRRASGIVFLTDYAKNAISKSVSGFNCAIDLIPHGVENRFYQVPRAQISFDNFSEENPFSVIYVSVVMPYKHQLEVVDAVVKLRSMSVPIEIRFVGAAYGAYGTQFQARLKEADPKGSFLKWAGHVPFESLHTLYHDADAFLFASSCENLPNILIEAMAEGLPIACSNRGPMPEVLRDAGIYFDPENADQIAESLLNLAKDQVLRARLAKSAWEKAQIYSWKLCAAQTFNFIARVVRAPRRK